MGGERVLSQIPLIRREMLILVRTYSCMEESVDELRNWQIEQLYGIKCCIIAERDHEKMHFLMESGD